MDVFDKINNNTIVNLKLWFLCSKSLRLSASEFQAFRPPTKKAWCL